MSNQCVRIHLSANMFDVRDDVRLSPCRDMLKAIFLMDVEQT